MYVCMFVCMFIAWLILLRSSYILNNSINILNAFIECKGC